MESAILIASKCGLIDSLFHRRGQQPREVHAAIKAGRAGFGKGQSSRINRWWNWHAQNFRRVSVQLKEATTQADPRGYFAEPFAFEHQGFRLAENGNSKLPVNVRLASVNHLGVTGDFGSATFGATVGAFH
jgi:hypothetical protein